MKKRKIKNYLKLVLLLIGIQLVMVNCEKDIELHDLTENNQEFSKPIKNLTFNEALKDTDFTQISTVLNLKKMDATHKINQYNEVFIDTKNIIKIIKKDYISYTFLVRNTKHENKNTFTNLIIEKSSNKTRGYLAHYTPTKEYLIKKSKDLKTPFQGSVSLSIFTENLYELLNNLNNKYNLSAKINDCFFQTITIETSCASGQHWPGDNSCTLTGSSRASTRYVEALMCDDGGGGGSGTIYEFPPISIAENETIGIGGGGDSGYVPPSGSTHPNLPEEITDICNQGYVKDTNGNCVEMVDDDYIFSDNLIGKEKCLNDLLDKNGNTYVQNLLKNFRGESEFDINIVSKNKIFNDQNKEINGQTRYLPGSKVINIDISTSQANINKALEVARTILHKYIHADMYRKLYTKSPTSEDLDFRTTYNSYEKTTFEPTQQHQTMADLYIISMRDALKHFHKNELSIDYNKYVNYFGEEPSDNFYEAIAWRGLRDHNVNAYLILSDEKKELIRKEIENISYLTGDCP